MSRERKYLILLFIAMTLLLLATWALWFFIATRNAEDPRSKVMVEREDWLELRIGGAPVLFCNACDSDSILTILHEQRPATVTRTTVGGRWTSRFLLFPWCHGRVSAPLDSLSQPTIDPRAIIQKNILHTEKRLSDLDLMAEEMEYFFDVHAVQDAGYELVTDFYEQTLRETTRLTAVLAQLQRCLTADSLTLSRHSLHKVTYLNNKDSLVTDTCFFNGNHLQLKRKHTPQGARPVLPNAQLPEVKPIKTVPSEQDTTLLNGFALRVTPEKGVQLGEWEDGRFKGERLEYNANRIYGIDIARYQHEHGRRRYAIDWSKLRITSLGTKSKKTIVGEVDYPVSFCYIKATEGTNVRNRYYQSDYQQARKHGVNVGTYHFFSTKTTGKAQAKWFLKNLKYKQGDFPPVIDIEPSDAQIRRMGGIERLFDEVRVWLKMVEDQTGKRPILYINQMFVNKYLPLAPDLKRDYCVWIARYGEYKPDVHMLFWQLSPDGRVRGIVPQVDINVFNGYSEKFQQYLETL